MHCAGVRGGYRLTACAFDADSHCDVSCEDPGKPNVYSHWERGEGCPWACDAGYELREWDKTEINYIQ